MTRSMNYVLASSLAALAVCLGGCATTQGPVQPVVHVVTQTVQVAVPVACVKAMPAVPDFLPRDKLLSGSGYQVLMQYDRELAKHANYEFDLVATLTACLDAGTAPAGGSQAASKGPSP